MTYATYAHRGAYPLIADRAARRRLRAGRNQAGRPGRDVRRDPAAGLSLGGAEVVLVISSILRLDLYMQIYLLTTGGSPPSSGCAWWRPGLVLIITRIALAGQ